MYSDQSSDLQSKLICYVISITVLEFVLKKLTGNAACCTPTAEMVRCISLEFISAAAGYANFLGILYIINLLGPSQSMMFAALLSAAPSVLLCNDCNVVTNPLTFFSVSYTTLWCTPLLGIRLAAHLMGAMAAHLAATGVLNSMLSPCLGSEVLKTLHCVPIGQDSIIGVGLAMEIAAAFVAGWIKCSSITCYYEVTDALIRTAMTAGSQAILDGTLVVVMLNPVYSVGQLFGCSSQHVAYSLLVYGVAGILGSLLGATVSCYCSCNPCADCPPVNCVPDICCFTDDEMPVARKPKKKKVTADGAEDQCTPDPYCCPRPRSPARCPPSCPDDCMYITPSPNCPAKFCCPPRCPPRCPSLCTNQYCPPCSPCCPPRPGSPMRCLPSYPPGGRPYCCPPSPAPCPPRGGLCCAPPNPACCPNVRAWVRERMVNGKKQLAYVFDIPPGVARDGIRLRHNVNLNKENETQQETQAGAATTQQQQQQQQPPSRPSLRSISPKKKVVPSKTPEQYHNSATNPYRDMQVEFPGDKQGISPKDANLGSPGFGPPSGARPSQIPLASTSGQDAPVYRVSTRDLNTGRQTVSQIPTFVDDGTPATSYRLTLQESMNNLTASGGNSSAAGTRPSSRATRHTSTKMRMPSTARSTSQSSGARDNSGSSGRASRRNSSNNRSFSGNSSVRYSSSVS